MEQSSSFVQHQPFQLYLLPRNSSLISCAKTMAKRMQEQKRRRKKCGKSETYRDEPVFSCSDKFLIREKSDCIRKSEDTHSYVKPESRMRKFEIRRSVEFSSAAARCIPWRGRWTQQPGNLSQQKKSPGMWTFPNLKPGVFKKRQ